MSGDSPDFGQARDFYTFAPETLARELPQFELLREVGKGSMGIVFEAKYRPIDGQPEAVATAQGSRSVALKISSFW